MNVTSDAYTMFWLMLVFTFVEQGKLWISHQVVHIIMLNGTKKLLVDDIHQKKVIQMYTYLLVVVVVAGVALVLVNVCSSSAVVSTTSRFDVLVHK